MTDINLLPWRENLRSAAKKEFLILCAVVLGLAILVLAMSLKEIKIKIRYQEALNTTLQNDIALLATKVIAMQAIKAELDHLALRKEALEKLQVERVAAGSLLAQVVEQIPPGVYLTRFEKKGTQLIFEGLAGSNLQVFQFMQKIARSRSITEPQLKEIKIADNKEEIMGYYFKMTARIRMTIKKRDF